MKWHIARREVSKSFRLSNGKYLKVLFTYAIQKDCSPMWFVSIVVAKSVRKRNDCLRKTEHSTKILYGKHTGGNLGMEPFMVALQCMLEFEKIIHNAEIRIHSASPTLDKIYSRLLRYGYREEMMKFNNGQTKRVFYKPV